MNVNNVHNLHNGPALKTTVKLFDCNNLRVEAPCRQNFAGLDMHTQAAGRAAPVHALRKWGGVLWP